MQSISFARSTAGSTSSLRRKNVAPRRIVNTQAQAKVRLKSAISFFLFFLVGVGRSEGHRGRRKRAGGTEMHLLWENDGGRRRFASLRETSIVAQKFLYTFLHPMCSFSRAKDVRCVPFCARFGQSFFAAGKIFSSRLLLWIRISLFYLSVSVQRR